MLNLVVASGYASIAYILYNSGDYQGAIENYSQAISLNPDDYISYFSRGLAHLMTKNYENAIADLIETIRLNPHYGEAYAERGVARAATGDHQAYYRLGNPEIAIADLQSSAKVALQHQNMAFHQKVVDLTRDIQS